MHLDEIFIKCLKWDKEQSIKNTISMLMVGFQSPGIILWSRHSIGGLSCLGGGLRSVSALVYGYYLDYTALNNPPPILSSEIKFHQYLYF